MGYLRMHCYACGGVWEVYRRQIDTAAARECPHCGKRVQPANWKTIQAAYKAMSDANDAFDEYRPAVGFGADYIADRVFANADLREIAAHVLNIENALETDAAQGVEEDS